MRTTVGLSFIYIYMRYDKEPIDIPQQLQLLQQRGLTIRDINKAVNILSSMVGFGINGFL